MKWAIPSTGRSDTVASTIDLLGKTDVRVYVKESEYDDYLKTVSKSNLISYSNDVIGIGAIRKHLYEDNKDQNYVFEIDDDITSFEWKFSDGRMELIVDAGHIREIVDNCYQVAYDLGTPLFGFVASLGPKLYTQMDHCHFSGFINFVAAGIIPELMGNMNFDTRYSVMHEDHDLSLQVKYYKRFLYIDNRYAVKSKVRMIRKGGLSTIRNKDEHMKCQSILKQKWPQVVHPSGKKADKVVLNVQF